MDSAVQVVALARLTPAESAAAIALVERAAEHDGMRPISEHVWLHLREGGDSHSQHLLARDPDKRLVGYAHLDITDEVEGPSAELAVDPIARHSGTGRLLVERLIDLSPDGRLRLWAHGEQAGAIRLATGMGFTLNRVLWQMRRSLFAPLPRAEFPADVEIRSFRLGHDEQAWLDLNARAFVNLPDLGSMTRADLDRRLHEDWFSADGFLMAWSGDELVGFHWTKVHGYVGPSGTHDHESIGEVYVVGVDPDRRGQGLGRALTLAGLHHLRSLGLRQAMLYVDATNTSAISLYETLGFARWDTDVLFRRA